MTIDADSSEVREALGAAASRVLPSAEALRDGGMICGIECRYTLGRMVLFDISGNAIFAQNDCGVDPAQYDVDQAFYILADENLDEVVNVIDDPALLREAVEKFIGGFAPWKGARIADQMADWLRKIRDAMPGGSGSGDKVPQKQYWWTSVVDQMASEYNWSEEFIMWMLPVVRLVRYQGAMSARASGDPVVDDISDSVAGALDTLEGMQDNG